VRSIDPLRLAQTSIAACLLLQVGLCITNDRRRILNQQRQIISRQLTPFPERHWSRLACWYTLRNGNT
jgi:hypothetical protein